MSRGEIMTKLRLKDEKHFREHYQQAGITLGVIAMTLPDKPRSSKQRYRLTEQGRALLAKSAINHAIAETTAIQLPNLG